MLVLMGISLLFGAYGSAFYLGWNWDELSRWLRWSIMGTLVIMSLQSVICFEFWKRGIGI